GYATGREVVQYGAGYGALGWITGLTILVGFAIIAFLMFEIARLFRAYDYRSLVKQVLGPFWFLYDIIYFLLAILIIVIVISVTVSILESTLSLIFCVCVTMITVLAVMLNFYGIKWIERFKTFGTTALFIGYIIFAILVISNTWGDMKEVFATGDTSYVESFSWWTLILSGLIYVGYN